MVVCGNRKRWEVRRDEGAWMSCEHIVLNAEEEDEEDEDEE